MLETDSLGDLRVCSRLQLRTCLEWLQTCSSLFLRANNAHSLVALSRVRDIDTAHSRQLEDTQCLAAGASIGPHCTKPRIKPQRPTSTLGNAATPMNVDVSVAWYEKAVDIGLRVK